MRMHAMGDMYIHRDVKPHNVLLTWAQVPVPVHGLICASFNATLAVLSSPRGFTVSLCRPTYVVLILH